MPSPFSNPPTTLFSQQQPAPPMSGPNLQQQGQPPQPPQGSKIYPGQPAAPGADLQDPTNSQAYVDQFAKLWENDPVDPNAPKPEPSIFDAPPEVFQKAAEKLDYAKLVTPDVYAAIHKGGEEGYKAFVQVLNTVGRDLHSNALSSAVKFSKYGADHGSRNAQSEVIQSFKLSEAASTLQELNPIFGQPGYAQNVEIVQKQLIKKNPKLSGKEIGKLTMKYYETMGFKMPEAPKPEQQKGGAPVTDYEVFFS